VSNFIFRKLGGRIVPIKISSEKAGETATRLIRRVKAEARMDGATARVGTMFLNVPKTGPRATIENVDVVNMARKQGIASEMMDYAAKLLGRAGKKVLRGELLHEAQVKIRARLGRTAFIGHGFPPHGESSRLLNQKEASLAVRTLKQSKIPSHITASTIIPKKWWKKK
jgi:predicted GNAT family acetyltransferase